MSQGWKYISLLVTLYVCLNVGVSHADAKNRTESTVTARISPKPNTNVIYKHDYSNYHYDHGRPSTHLNGESTPKHDYDSHPSLSPLRGDNPHKHIGFAALMLLALPSKRQKLTPTKAQQTLTTNATSITHRGNVCTYDKTPGVKPLNGETGLYYYGYRYYDPVTGRWPSRDPIEEDGGVNLYGFVENDAVGNLDILGMQVFIIFDQSTGILTITDLDTNKTIVICAESGGKPKGDPIPVGQYEILERGGDPDFYRLDPFDEEPGTIPTNQQGG